MRKTIALACLLTACGSPVPKTPEAAFDRLRVAVAAHDAKLLYDALDTESRWALDSAWKSQRDVAALVGGWPSAARDRELRRVEAARRAATSRELLADPTTRVGDPFAGLGGGSKGLGRLLRVESAGPRAARVVTTTGLVVALAAGNDGEWGFAGLANVLTRWRDDTANDVKRLAEDARPPERR